MAFSPHSAAISRGLKSLAFARNNNYPNPLSPDHLLSDPGVKQRNSTDYWHWHHQDCGKYIAMGTMQ